MLGPADRGDGDSARGCPRQGAACCRTPRPWRMARRALYNTRCRSKSGATAVHCLAAVDRAAPYTVPMKAVLHAVWRAGTSPSSTLGLAPRGTHGRVRQVVPVRAVLCPGAALQPLRPRSALLHTKLFERGAPYRTARGGPTLPAQPWRTHGPRGTITALAHPASAHRACRGAAGGRRKHRDASGLPWRPRRCSTGCMDQQSCRSEPHRQPRRERGIARRARRRAAVPALRRSAHALGPARLPAPLDRRASSAP